MNNESTEKQSKYIFKICLLGQAGIGKTCITRSLCFNEFNINIKETIGLNFYRYKRPIYNYVNSSHYGISNVYT